jgi:hypothetical protein
MLARLRISLPDRPGSLGRLGSAIGTAGADIVAIEVLESESGRALDDVTVTVRDPAHLGSVTSAITALAGLDVVGVRHPVPPATVHADLELVTHLLARPDTALRTLVDGAPRALGADWAALLEFAGPLRAVPVRSDHAPAEDSISVAGPLRLAALTLPGAVTGGAALVPLGEPDPMAQGLGIGLLVVRDTGPGFHHSELWRLSQLGALMAVALPVGA